MPEKQVSRRRFLTLAGLAAGGAAAACCYAGVTTVQSLNLQAPTEPVDTPSFTYGSENTTGQRVLVAYATRTGSTVGVASAVGEALGKRGFRVDVKPIIEQPKLEGYGLVILGSAINGGQWLPEALTYAQDNQAALANIPLAVFCVHGMNLGDDETAKSRRLAYLDKVRAIFPKPEETFFAGMGVDPATTPALARWIYRLFGGSEGDNRDWDKINAWGQSVFA